MAEENLKAKLTLDAEGNAADFLASVDKAFGMISSRLGGGGGLSQLLGGVGTGLMGIVAGAAAGAASVAFFTMEAIKAAAGTEKLELQVASFIQRSGSWNAASERSVFIIRDLDQVALRTGEDVDSLGATFRSLTTVMGGTDKQLVGMTEELSVLGKLAGTTSKEILSIFQQAAFTGTVRGPEAKELLSRFTMTPEQIRQAYLGGQLLEYLTKKLGDMKGPADALASSWDVLLQVFKTGKDQVLSDLGLAFDPLKQGLIGLRDLLREGDFRAGIREIASGLRQIVSAVTDVVRAAADLIPFKEIFSAWGGLLRVVASQWVVVAGAAQEFITVLAAGKDIVVDFFSGGEGHLARMKADYDAMLLSIGLNADKTKERLDAIWNPKEGAAATAGKTKPPPLYLDEQAIRKNYSNVTDMIRKLSDEVLSVGTGPEWEKAQSRINVHIDDLEKGFRLLSEEATRLGRSLPKEDVDRFNALLQKLKGNLGAEEWLKLSDKAKEATFSLRGLAAATAEEFAALEQGQRGFDLDKLERAANVLPEAFRKPLLALVEGARTALEQDLPAIVQRGLEKAAAIAYSRAVTIGDGVRAAFLKITSALKTEGQIWSDYLEGIWSGITSGLGTVLLALETGTGTIKDALKGILNSLLQSFNQMVIDMVKRWLLGKEQMKGGSPIESLFGGTTKAAVDAQGNVVGSYEKAAEFVGPPRQVGGGSSVGSPTAQGVARIGGAAVAGYGIGSMVGGASGAPGFSTGAAIGGTVAAAGIALAAAGVFGGALAGAAAGSVVPIIGTIIGAIIGGLIAVLSAANTEMKVYSRQLAPQIKTAAEGVQSSVIDLYAKSLLPDTAGFAKSVNTIIKAYLVKSFEVHAGSNEDIQADIKTLLTGVIPTELLHTLIGQQRTGGQDLAGISGASKYGGALDPNAPINKMLTDLGFTANKIQDLAGQIDQMAPEDWMKMLDGLVSVVAGAAKLGTALSKSYAETITGIDTEAAKSPAGKLAERAAAVTDLLKAVSFYTGTEQITKGQEAIAAAQQFYADATTAMAQLSAMSKQITAESADSIKKVQDALKSPAELYAQSFEDLQHDYERMRFVTNPEDLAAAWGKARADFESVAGVLVQRVREIRALIDNIAAAVKGVNQSIDQQLFDITLGEKTGHDKSLFLYDKINELYKQLQTAKTPEEVTSLTSQIQSLTGTLLSYVGTGDPHRAEAVDFVKRMLELVRSAALGNLAGQKTVAETALDAVMGNLDDVVSKFGTAADFATSKLTAWGVEIADELNALGPVLKDLVTNFTDVNTALSGGGTGPAPGGGPGPGKDKRDQLADDFTALGSGVSDASDSVLEFTVALKAGTKALTG